MDLYCRRWGEPWDMDYVNWEMKPQEKTDFRSGKCCPACRGKTISEKPFRATLAGVLGDLLGDDIDGLAAEMEDAEYLLGNEFWQ